MPGNPNTFADVPSAMGFHPPATSNGIARGDKGNIYRDSVASYHGSDATMPARQGNAPGNVTTAGENGTPSLFSGQKSRKDAVAEVSRAIFRLRAGGMTLDEAVSVVVTNHLGGVVGAPSPTQRAIDDRLPEYARAGPESDTRDQDHDTSRENAGKFSGRTCPECHETKKNQHAMRIHLALKHGIRTGPPRKKRSGARKPRKNAAPVTKTVTKARSRGKKPVPVTEEKPSEVLGVAP